MAHREDDSPFCEHEPPVGISRRHERPDGIDLTEPLRSLMNTSAAMSRRDCPVLLPRFFFFGGASGGGVWEF